jgi:cell pole-organizing protein PopZ
MEEILSSIRRIIADEEADHASAGDEDELGAAEARAEALDDEAETLAEAADGDQDGDDDVLELTKVVRESGEIVDLRSERTGADPDEEAEPAGPDFPEDRPDDEIEFAAREPGDAIQDAPYRKDEPVPSEQARISELMSASAATVATGAFAKLSQALQRTPEEASVADRSGRTVEQFIEDIARPMLKDWLDEHLPAIVEQLVQKEIQKLSRRAELN